MVQVTVCVAAYNAERYLHNCLSSLVDQDMPSEQYEVIVINDGSYDGTNRIMEEFEFCKNFCFYAHMENRGLVYSCNEALRLARGRYFVRLDADDYAMIGFLSGLYSLVNSRDNVCGCCDYLVFEKDEIKYIKVDSVQNFFSTQACGVIYPTKLLRDIGGYKDYFFEEFDLHLRLKGKNIIFKWIRHPLWVYRKHTASMTANSIDYSNGIKELIKEWGGDYLKSIGVLKWKK